MEKNFKLFYTEEGRGTPLVLLHGNGEDSSYFSAQMEYLKNDYRVIAVDTRGHGRSPRGTAPFTLRQFAEDLKELLDQMGLRRILLLGFSDGANIAMLFALSHPEYVEKLILDGGNIRPSGVKLRYQIPIVLGWCASLAAARFDQKAVKKKELLGLMVKEPHIRPEDFAGFSVPTLVMAGTKDMIRDSHTRKLQKSIPGSRLCVMDGTHFIAAERPEEFNRHVHEFLEEGS